MARPCRSCLPRRSTGRRARNAISIHRLAHRAGSHPCRLTESRNEQDSRGIVGFQWPRCDSQDRVAAEAKLETFRLHPNSRKTMKPFQKKRSIAAFTLLEIMLVVMIIALLAGSAIYLMRGNVDTAKIVRADADIQNL